MGCCAQSPHNSAKHVRRVAHLSLAWSVCAGYEHLKHSAEHAAQDARQALHHDTQSADEAAAESGSAAAADASTSKEGADEPQFVDVGAISDLFREAIHGDSAGSAPSTSRQAEQRGTAETSASASDTGSAPSNAAERADAAASELGTAAAQLGQAAKEATADLAADLQRAADGLTGSAHGSGGATVCSFLSWLQYAMRACSMSWQTGIRMWFCSARMPCVVVCRGLASCRYSKHAHAQFSVLQHQSFH